MQINSNMQAQALTMVGPVCRGRRRGAAWRSHSRPSPSSLDWAVGMGLNPGLPNKGLNPWKNHFFVDCLDPFPIYAIHCTNSRVWTCSWVQVTLLEHSCTLLELQPFNVWACVFIRVEFRSSCVRFALRELMLWNSICICVRLHCTTAFHAC